MRLGQLKVLENYRKVRVQCHTLRSSLSHEWYTALDKARPAEVLERYCKVCGTSHFY